MNDAENPRQNRCWRTNVGGNGDLCENMIGTRVIQNITKLHHHGITYWQHGFQHVRVHFTSEIQLSHTDSIGPRTGYAGNMFLN